MSIRSRGARTRLAIGALAAAVPLVGAPAATAALGGANPLTTTSRPDLRSVTLTGSNTARYCFDKSVDSIPNIGGFVLGGYRAGATINSIDAVASGSCVNATFNTSVSGDVDNIEQHTFGQVMENAVRTALFGNRADSTALTGSISKNGTRGLSTAPDLQGVAIIDNNRIAYTYDQNVRPSTIVGVGGFHFYNATTGQDVPSNSAGVSSTDPKTVIAQFPLSPATQVTTGSLAWVNESAVQSQTVEHTGTGVDSAAMPESIGQVFGRPDLQSAQYTRVSATTITAQGGTACPATTCVVVDYTFDEGVSIAAPAATANYGAGLADGTTVNPDTIYQPSPGSATVRAVFDNASLFDEHLVAANVFAAEPPAGGSSRAVSSLVTGLPNTNGAAPIGGNAGADSSGFSTAPEILRVAFDNATNVVSVLLDQRVFNTVGQSPANARLLDSNGNVIGTANAISSCPPTNASFPCGLATTGESNPGGSTVYFQFPPATVQVGNGKALELVGGLNGATPFGFAVSTGLPGAAIDAVNLQQIATPTAVANAKALGMPKRWSHRKLTAKRLKKLKAAKKARFQARLKRGYYRH